MHFFFLARPWCKEWSQSGIVVCSAYFVAMISLCTTQISNSSLSSLCLGWGLICHKIFPNICFFLSFRFPFELVHQIEIFFTLLPLSRQKTAVPQCLLVWWWRQEEKDILHCSGSASILGSVSLNSGWGAGGLSH